MSKGTIYELAIVPGYGVWTVLLNPNNFVLTFLFTKIYVIFGGYPFHNAEN